MVSQSTADPITLFAIFFGSESFSYSREIGTGFCRPQRHIKAQTLETMPDYACYTCQDETGRVWAFDQSTKLGHGAGGGDSWDPGPRRLRDVSYCVAAEMLSTDDKVTVSVAGWVYDGMVDEVSTGWGVGACANDPVFRNHEYESEAYHRKV